MREYKVTITRKPRGKRNFEVGPGYIQKAADTSNLRRFLIQRYADTGDVYSISVYAYKKKGALDPVVGHLEINGETGLVLWTPGTFALSNCYLVDRSGKLKGRLRA